MSSPIAKDNKNKVDQALINIHKEVSHHHRIDILSKHFYQEINSLKIEKKEIKVLDIGCGDMTMLHTISQFNSHLKCIGVDIYPNKNNWKDYYEFDGKNLPFLDNSFDVIIFSDVLHHAFDQLEDLIKEAKRVANFIIIKDHFEYGMVSRKLLQIADIIGNYGYGVSIPKRYFDKKMFNLLVEKHQLKEIKIVHPIFLYEHLPLVKYIFKAKYQFMSVLKINP